jgi:hypothetical protein
MSFYRPTLHKICKRDFTVFTQFQVIIAIIVTKERDVFDTVYQVSSVSTDIILMWKV